MLLSSVKSLQPARLRFVNSDGSNAITPVGYTTIDRYFLEKNGNSNGNVTMTGVRMFVKRVSFRNGANAGGVVVMDSKYGCRIEAVVSTAVPDVPPKGRPISGSR